jgi:hypothetical protein
LATIGVKLSQLKLFDPIRIHVQIIQKTIKNTPADKLYEAFISRMAGAYGLVEINTRLRTDPALAEVCDVFHVSGLLRFDAAGSMVEIVLDQEACLVRSFIRPLRALLTPLRVVVNLGET